MLSWRFLLVVFVAACNADEQEPTPSPSAPAPEPTLTMITVEPEVEPEAEPVETPGRLIQKWRDNYTLAWFSPRPKLPDPELSTEAKLVLGKHGGTLTWHPDAPHGGQWEYKPNSNCGWGLDQYDHSASIAVILAGTDADNQCRICGPKHKGRWVNPGPPPKLAGCSDEEWEQIRYLYNETECRLGRHSTGCPPLGY